MVLEGFYKVFQFQFEILCELYSTNINSNSRAVVMMMMIVITFIMVLGL